MLITSVSSLLRLSLPPTSQAHPFLVCFLLRFYRTMLSSLVPQNSLNTCPANLTPDAVYPVIRCPIHSYHRYKRNYLFLTSSIALTRLHHWFTFVQLFVFAPTVIVVTVFPYRSPPDCFQNSQHKVV